MHREELTASFPVADRHDCDWGQLDGDERLDFYCTVGAEGGSGAADNEAWIQQEDGTFVDRAAELGVNDPFGPGRWVLVEDLDSDGRDDILVTTDLRVDERPRPSRLFLGREDGFEDARDPALAAVGGVTCLTTGDFDGDGAVDVFVCTWQTTHLLRNTGDGGFEDVSAEAAVLRRGVRSSAFADMDGDGQLDLVHVTSRGVQVELQADGEFLSAYTLHPTDDEAPNDDASGPTRDDYRSSFNVRLAPGDADGDGDIDIFVVLAADSCEAPPEPADRPDVLLLNDGTGHLADVIEAPPTPGCGDDARAHDVDGDGDDEFLVLNGYWQTQGPVQLLDLVVR